MIAGAPAWWPAGFHFLAPAWFALLPLVWWLAWLGRAASRGRGSRLVLVHPEAAVFERLAQKVRASHRWWLSALGASLLLGALARPQSVGPWITPPPLGRQLVLLVDVSQSMSISDFHVGGARVQRIDVLKGVVTRFIRAQRADRFALIAFASRAATLVPMTADRRLVESMLQRLRVGVIGDNTAIGDALVLALKQLRARKGPRPALILFSDGDNTAGQVRPRDAVAIARRLGVAIYTVAIGGDGGAANSVAVTDAGPPDPSAPIGLREIAARTGGRYYRGGSREALQAILHDIDRLERTERPPATERRITEWYVWPLMAGGALFALAGLPLPAAGRRRRQAGEGQAT